MHLCHRRLDLLELRAVSPIAFSGIFADGLPNQFHAVPWIRVIAKELGPARTTFFFKLREKLDHGERVVAGVVHSLRTEQIGFALGVARIFQKKRLHSE